VGLAQQCQLLLMLQVIVIGDKNTTLADGAVSWCLQLHAQLHALESNCADSRRHAHLNNIPGKPAAVHCSEGAVS